MPSAPGAGIEAGAGAGDGAEQAAVVFPAMGTVVSLRAYGPTAGSTLAAAAALVAELEALLSRTRPDSEISALNRSAGRWTRVHPDTDAVLREALHHARHTGGAFDPAVGVLVDLWGIAHRGAPDGWQLPDDTTVRAALRRCGHRQLERVDDGRYRLRPGVELDLGGIGKGYAVHRVRDLCRRRGITSALLSLGGSSVAAFGARPDGAPWKIGLRGGTADQGGLLGVVHLVNGFLSTSGDDEQYVVHGGRRYHHILDLRTGHPARSGLRSVTVVAGSGAQAEAYSTALLVMGPAAALERYDRDGDFEAVLVTTEGRIICTPGIGGQFRS